MQTNEWEWGLELPPKYEYFNVETNLHDIWIKIQIKDENPVR